MDQRWSDTSMSRPEGRPTKKGMCARRVLPRLWRKGQGQGMQWPSRPFNDLAYLSSEVHIARSYQVQRLLDATQGGQKSTPAVQYNSDKVDPGRAAPSKLPAPSLQLALRQVQFLNLLSFKRLPPACGLKPHLLSELHNVRQFANLTTKWSPAHWGSDHSGARVVGGLSRKDHQ